MITFTSSRFSEMAKYMLHLYINLINEIIGQYIETLNSINWLLYSTSALTIPFKNFTLLIKE